ncbi:MAG: prephenate dehydrogenase/arogenate dehydrogenase family protein [Lachnospiraceae bacterium]|nr:prephenate dehydrogenase/arogenate dehydrogenase family protein [Lachnospiraceae bacterium]
MTVGVVGLGLIGGSFVKAYSKAGHTVLAKDIDESVMQYAKLCGAIDDKLDESNIADCDLILICTYPEAAIEYMEENGRLINKKTIVIDCCGTKEVIVDKGREIAVRYGYTYVGGHPMAGTQYSGFKYSRDNLYKGAPMVIVPPVYDDIILLDRIKKLLSPAGFGSITVTTAAEHDVMIAYTSQLAHVVSNAYVKSPTVRSHKGFSAGSYKDMTRVAWLNPEMWTELFLENKDNLLNELDILIDNLNKYRVALENEDKDTLLELLREGRQIKEEIDG